MVDIPYHTHTFDIPTASEGEIRAGLEAGKAITPDRLFPVLADKADKATTLAGYGITDAATKEQGKKADTAIQPERVSAVGFSGRYDDLLSKPDLGNASSLSIGTTADTVAAGDDTRIVNAVQKSIAVSAGVGLTGGGALAANIALALSSTSLASLALADTAVQPARKFTVGTGLTGGGDFSADRSIALNTASIASLALADSAVQPERTITAGSGLAGGGDLSANRSIALNAATIASLVLADNAVPNVRTVSAGAGLTGGGALKANITIGLNPASVASLAKADSGAQAVDSAKLQGYTTATLPISAATKTALDGKATTADGALARTAVQPSDLGELACKNTITTTDITATGSTAGGALLTRGGAWVDPSGGGDMFRAIYDPTNKATDAFSMDSMAETATAKVMSDAERTRLAGMANGATANTGTVTSIAVAVPAGLVATGAITTSGTITISYASGYQGYTTAEANKLAGIATGADKTPVLATVATSGSYNDLGDKPVIPAAQVQTDWNATSGLASIKDKPSSFPPSEHAHTPTQVGLGNADNTSDANKPVSIAQQAVLDGKLDKSGGTMTGDLTVSNGRGIIATFVVLDQAQPVNATDAAPKAYVDRKSGVGRTWQDVTSQRIKSTNYVNNTGRDIIVAVRRNSSGNNSLGIWINGQQILDIYKWDSDPRTNYGSVTVPDGATYSLYWDGNNQTVWELR